MPDRFATGHPRGPPRRVLSSRSDRSLSLVAHLSSGARRPRVTMRPLGGGHPPPVRPTERDDTIVTSRLASDAEVTTWQEDGWILIEGLVGTDEIDAVAEDLREVFPSAEELHADPEGVTERWKGHPVEPKEVFVWPDEGPGFRPDQQRWSATFPFPGTGRSTGCASTRRSSTSPSGLSEAPTSACTRPAPVPKYAGVTNYEQPMHIDRNHSWLPPGSESPWWNLEGFLYLSDISDGR